MTPYWWACGQYMLVGARPPEKTAAAPLVYGRFRLPTGGSCDRRITAAGQHVSDYWTRSQTMKRKPPEQARNARGNMSALGDSTPLSAGCVRGDSASDSASEATTSGCTWLISIISRPPEVLKHPPLRTRAEDGLCLPAPSRRQTSFAETDPLPLATAGFVVHVFMHIDFY